MHSCECICQAAQIYLQKGGHSKSTSDDWHVAPAISFAKGLQPAFSSFSAAAVDAFVSTLDTLQAQAIALFDGLYV
jgi:hypothetical protein